ADIQMDVARRAEEPHLERLRLSFRKGPRRQDRRERASFEADDDGVHQVDVELMPVDDRMHLVCASTEEPDEKGSRVCRQRLALASTRDPRVCVSTAMRRDERWILARPGRDPASAEDLSCDGCVEAGDDLDLADGAPCDGVSKAHD